MDNTATHHQVYASSPYYASHPHSQNPNPQTLRPPGVDPAGSSVGGAHEAYDPSVLYAHSEYYQDPNVANSLKNWALEVLRYYGSNPNDAVSDTGAIMPPTNATLQPHGNSTKKKGAKKTTVVQSVWCEVCKVECNTKEVLDKHKMGKKHKKKEEKLTESITTVVQSVWCEVCKVECNTKEVLDKHKMGKKHKKEEKLTESITPPPPAASGVSIYPSIGPQENPASSGVQKTKKKAADPAEDLETKRRRLMEEGAASDAVRVCAICNVVCNSDMVFTFHNAGKKHAAMMVKQRVIGTGVATPT